MKQGPKAQRQTARTQTAQNHTAQNQTAQDRTAQGEIRISHLAKAYGDHPVFTDFSAVFEKGKTTCLMAPSGAGKTTLLRILAGLEEADSGEIEGLEDLRKSMVFQEDRLCENLSASANIRLVRRKKPWGRDKKAQDQISEAMTAVGLSGCEDQPVREFSGGMRQRTALLRALYSEWDILFLDEPFKGLDEETKELVMAYTKEQCAGKTVIFVTHDRSEAERMGGSLYEMEKKN